MSSDAPYGWYNEGPLDIFAYEQLTVAASSVGFTAATYNSASGAAVAAFVRLSTAQVRWRADGTAPTSTVGTPFEAGQDMIVWGSADLASIRFIRTGATSGVLDVHYARAHLL